MKTLSIVSIAALLLTAIGLFIGANQYSSEATELAEATRTIEYQKSIIEQQEVQFDESKENMQTIVDSLENRIKILEK